MTNPSHHNSGLTRGYITALLSAVLLSTTSVFISYLTKTYHLPSLVLALWRDVFASLTLVIGLSVFNPKLLRIQRSQLIYLIFFGFMFAFFNAFWTFSVALNGASVSNVLVYSSTAFTAILGYWLLKEKLDWVRVGAIFVCLSGCVFVAKAYEPQVWNTNLSGILTGLMSGFTYALYTILGKKASQRGINPWTTLAYIFGFAAIVLLVVDILFAGILPGTPAAIDELVPQMETAGWGVLFALAAGPTVLGFVLYNMSLVHLSPGLTNMILTSEPVFTVTIAFFTLGEILDGWQLLGTVMILGTVLMMRVHEGRKEKLALNQA